MPRKLQASKHLLELLALQEAAKARIDELVLAAKENMKAVGDDETRIGDEFRESFDARYGRLSGYVEGMLHAGLISPREYSKYRALLLRMIVTRGRALMQRTASVVKRVSREKIAG